MATAQAQQQRLPHDDYGPQLNAIIGLMLVLSAAFVFTRTYLKVQQHRKLWWDDYVLLFAWLVLFVVAVLTCTIVSLGYGRHSWDISPANFPQVALYGSVAGTLTIVGSACSKTSFALTLLRLPIGWMNYLVWAMIVSLNVLMALSAVSVWFECRGPSDGPQSCLPVDRALTFAMFTGAYSAACDFTLAVLPWKILWNLTMDRAEKVGVLFAMSMGVFAGLAAIMKTTKLSTLEAPDIIEGVSLAAWGMTEIAVTAMAASTPILRALFPRSNRMPLGSRDDQQARRPRAADEASIATTTASTLRWKDLEEPEPTEKKLRAHLT